MTTKTTKLQPQLPTVVPLNNFNSILLFGGPALLLFISFHWFRGILLKVGINEFDALVTSMTVPLAIIFILPLVGYHLEKQENPDLSFRQRFRYPSFSPKFILYGLIGYGVITTAYAIFMIFNLRLIKAGIITYPSNVGPFFDPNIVFNWDQFQSYVGAPLHHNWKVLSLYLLMYFFNIVGEELWWRGYILPRQEKYHGAHTWIIHGLLWNMFHIFKWWDLLPLLPVTLCIAFVAQRRQENWTPFIMHLLMNGVFLIALIPQILV